MYYTKIVKIALINVALNENLDRLIDSYPAPLFPKIISQPNRSLPLISEQ